MATTKNKPVAGIILAAGGSSRLGKPKQLLEWQGKTLINWVIETALSAGLDPVVVVLGSNYDQILANVEKKSQIMIVRNENWTSGQSSSLILGIQSLGSAKVPVMFLLVDQPQIPVGLIKEIITEYHTSPAEVVMTNAAGRRTPPILFDPKCIKELLKLKGDEGGRRVIAKFITNEVSVENSSFLLDIDTEDDYRRLINDG